MISKRVSEKINKKKEKKSISAIDRSSVAQPHRVLISQCWHLMYCGALHNVNVSVMDDKDSRKFKLKLLLVNKKRIRMEK